MRKIYLDYAATTPTDPEVVEAMLPYFHERFGNASSPHSIGQEAKKAIEEAREALARFIGARADEVIFTSGGTESNNHALFGVAQTLKNKGSHMIISRIEHHSVLEAAAQLEKEGFKVTYLSVDRAGLVDPEDVKKAITDKTILISVMHANNEIGTLQPISEIGEIAREKNIYVHTDAAQTVGHIPVHVNELKVDLLTIVGHKFYAPKGIGALYIRRATQISPLLVGGGQERGRRSSTHNLSGIVGLGEAVNICTEKMADEIKTQTVLRDRLIHEVLKNIEGTILNGHPTQRLPHNANFSFSGIEGESLLLGLDMLGVAVSMGSACTSGAMKPSYVLKALGLPEELAYGSIRVTIGRWTREEEIDYFLNHLPQIVERLRNLSPSSKK